MTARPGEIFRRGDSNMLAYLAMMAPRLVELHRVLKPTGSLYLHCDPTASHYLKLTLHRVFGAERFLNEITWKRTVGIAMSAGISAQVQTFFFFTRRVRNTHGTKGTRSLAKSTSRISTPTKIPTAGSGNQ